MIDQGHFLSDNAVHHNMHLLNETSSSVTQLDFNIKSFDEN